MLLTNLGKGIVQDGNRHFSGVMENHGTVCPGAVNFHGLANHRDVPLVNSSMTIMTVTKTTN